MEMRNLFGLESLTDLGKRGGIDMRPTLLRVLTDLYVHRLSHTADEERHYTELALRLLEAVDVATRVAVARRFARYNSPPLRVLQRLARDLPEVVGELRSHPLLKPSTPIAAAPLQSASAHVAVDDATDDKDHRAGTARVLDTATAGELNDLFFAASAHERRLILLNLHVVAPLPAGRIRTVQDPSISARLEVAALSGKRVEFAHLLAAALRIPSEQARRIARDELGEPVVVAARVLTVPRDVLYRILMFVNPAIGHSVERVHALAALHSELTVPAAEGMLAIWQALQDKDRMMPKHRPLAWDNETRRRARPGAATHRSATAPRTSERRSAS